MLLFNLDELIFFSFVPMGIWIGTPGVSVGLYIYKGIIPGMDIHTTKTDWLHEPY